MPFAGVGGTSVRDSQYLIDNSLRFNDNDSPNLSRTPASAGNRQTWTVSFWIKRANLSTNQGIFSTYNGTASINTQCDFRFDDKFEFYDSPGTGSFNWYYLTNRVFRDDSAWYHFVLAVDTTQATASDRVKIYVNGVQETSFSSSTNPSLNDNTADWNNNVIHYIGKHSTLYYDGYLAEFHNIDGQQLSPTDFAEADEDSGIWKPIEYTGTYGTNGFYLDFENSGSLGADQSGNGNNFTPTNLASTDQTTDTPTNNFATLNTLDSTSATLSEGNLKAVVGPTLPRSTNSTISVSQGKWYFEVKITAVGFGNFGVLNANYNGRYYNASTNPTPYAYTDNAFYDYPGNIRIDGSIVATVASFTTGDIMGVALNIDDDEITFYKNGSSQGTFSKTFSGNYKIGFSHGGSSSSTTYELNTGNPSFSISSGNSDGNGYGNFEYAPPSGYLALCTQNLATVSPPTIDDGSAYFQTLTFTGNGGTQTLTFDGNSDLQADFMWFKERNLAANWHQLWDTSRGATVASSKRFYSNASSADDNITTGAGVRGVGTNTVEVGATAGINGSSQPLVLWAWKANGGTTSSNTDGTITSTVQANTTAGFSIVTYTGTGSNATVGHGLGVKPDMVIVKGRSSTENWGVQMANTLGFTNALRLNLTDAYGGVNGAGWWNDIAPTSTTVSIGTRSEVNTNGNNYIMYCFNNVEGYSKFGSYTGNGSTDGTFVYTGFRPSWIMLKRTDSGASWLIFDNKRVGYNLVSNRLYANDPQGEDTSTSSSLDLLSNGFKIRSTTAGDSSTNASGGTYIYMCFAENPFVSSTGIPVVAR